MKPIGDIDPKALGLTRGGDIARQQPQQRRQRMELPDWVENALLTLRTKFAAPDGARGEWGDSETVAYGRVLARIGPDNTRRVIVVCRERFTWRPSVAEVKAVADELTGREVIPDHALKSRQVLMRPLALPPHPGNPGRLYAKAKLLKLRGHRAHGPWQNAGQRESAESEFMGRVL